MSDVLVRRRGGLARERASMPARWVSQDVVALAAEGARTGRVGARFESSLHLDVGGFVVAVLPPGAPRMPNGVSVAGALAGPGAPQVGDRVLLTRRGLSAGPVEILWNGVDLDGDIRRQRLHGDRWDARVTRWSAEQRRGLRERAAAILEAPDTGDLARPDAPARHFTELLARASGVGIDDPARLLGESLARAGGFASDDVGARSALESLLAAVRSGDPHHAARAGRELAGRGSGLTPAGDDVLAATALTVAAAGAAGPGRRAWLAALVPPDLRLLTTSVSATLLELAVRGRGIGPARSLLDPRRPHDSRLRRELAALRGLGHTSGAVYAATIGVVALVLAPDENHTNHDKENG
jgi:hypothetical protein